MFIIGVIVNFEETLYNKTLSYREGAVNVPVSQFSNFQRITHHVQDTDYYSARCSATMSSSDCTERRKQQQQQRRSRSFKVTDFGTNRKLICDFLLVINTNLPHILHGFQVMADYICQISTSVRESITLTPSLGMIPYTNIAISDIHVPLKSRFLGLHFTVRIYWCIFDHFYVGSKWCKIHGHHILHRSRSPIMVPIESPYTTSY